MAPWPYPACAYGKALLNYYRLICKLETIADWRRGNDVASRASSLGFDSRVDQTQSRQRLAAALKLCRPGAKLRTWVPQLVTCLGVIRIVKI